MTNDKATRQAIAETIKGELKMNWDLAYDIADAILSRLSELQPKPKPVNATKAYVLSVLKKRSNDLLHPNLSNEKKQIDNAYELIERLMCPEWFELQPVNKAEEEPLEALKSVLNLRQLIEYPQDTKVEHKDEAIAIYAMLNKVEQAIRNAEIR